MATYEEIYGKRVREFDSDPTPDSYEGQVWYNLATGTLKSIVQSEAWVSSAAMLNVNSYQASSGTQTAAITSGGYQLPSSLDKSESYNGSGWSANPTIGTARGEVGGAGPQTAAIIVGGDRATPPLAYANTETFDGSSWSEQPDMNNARFGLGLAGEGTQTASLAFGGNPSPLLGKTEEYNGSSWSNQNDLNTPGAGMQGSGSGTQTAGLAFGRTPNGNSGATELYDGTNWTTSGAMNTSRDNAAGGGPQTAAYVAGGGGPSAVTATETFDGTTWTTSSATLGSAAKGISGTGNSSSGVAMGNYPAANTTSEYTRSVNVITAAAWASGNSFPINNRMQAQAGPQTAAISYGGRTYPGPNAANNNSSTYNGTSWTAIPSISTARYFLAGAKEGTQTAAMCVAGTATTGATNSTEEYDGSSWTGGGAYPISTSMGDHGGGTQTAAIVAGGYGGTPVPYTAQTATYNGSSWTALSSPSNLNTARSYGSMCGPQTAALLVSGQPGTGGAESWNGSAWTAVPVLNTTRNYVGASGTNTSALTWGGELPPGAAQTNVSESWNGSAWSTSFNMATPGYSGGASGSSSSALATGGTEGGSGRASATEEFTGETSTINIKTLTSS